ncbi:hypothetical protein DOTSEDRAFT_157159 [Dothistroma septosporum NZE10]|uniref:Uncharacterized protein n=1 Tax=Dothistroma septosporum (strain NZE10 / CBS 128990) TaxID=675120 RepID=N1PGI7_DOTSN|nr:hypothetical protein DOTSEDRAFT_157159 [Dothistroma septosporum NZE10]
MKVRRGRRTSELSCLWGDHEDVEGRHRDSAVSRHFADGGRQRGYFSGHRKKVAVCAILIRERCVEWSLRPTMDSILETGLDGFVRSVHRVSTSAIDTITTDASRLSHPIDSGVSLLEPYLLPSTSASIR